MTVDVSTDYLGLKLAHPITVSACPLTSSVASLEALQEAGAAAAVLPSIFEEQVEHDEMEVARLLDLWALSSPESADYFPELNEYNTGPNAYLELIADAKRSCQIPIIASLNGSTAGGWLRYAGLLEKAGADALEMNIYNIPVDPARDSNAVENESVELVRTLARELKIPVAAKLGPYYSALPRFAGRLAKAGARGLVLFNRFQAPDIDLETLRYEPALELSSPDDLRLALRWIAILRDQVSISLAATGGVHSANDVIKAILAGANVVACASSLIKTGHEQIGRLRDGLAAWMEKHEYTSVKQMQSSMSRQRCANPEGLLRASYMRALTSYTARG